MAEDEVLLVILDVGVAAVKNWDVTVVIEVTLEVCAPFLAFRQVQLRTSHQEKLTSTLMRQGLLRRLLLSQ